MSDPLVSVLVTVYNRELYLAATLQSILSSEFQDFEVIVVDDCSTDGSAAIAEEFSRVDSRIRFRKNEINLGDYGNRRCAASLARGEFLKYVDSDDLTYPHTLGVMVRAMVSNPNNVLALCHSDAEECEPYPWVLSPQESWKKHFLGRGCLSCGPTGAIIRRAAFESVGGFRPEWRVLSDIDLWLRISATGPVALMPPGLVWWRKHPGQEYRSPGAEQEYLQRGFELSVASLTSLSCPLDDESRATAIRRVRQHHARRLLALALRSGRPSDAYRLARRSKLTCIELLSGLRKYS